MLRCSKVIIAVWTFIFSVNGLHNSSQELLEPTTYRLPNDSLPLSYDLAIKTDIHRKVSSFTATVNIHVQIQTDTRKITLNYRHIDIDFVNLLTVSGNETVARNLTFHELQKFDFLVINLPTIYKPGDEFVLYISYRGQLNRETIGFFYGSYYDYDGELIYYAATQFETVYARLAMPCYDEPAKKARMSLTIVHGREYRAIANTEVISLLPLESDPSYSVTRFNATPPIQTYLLAFSVSNFDYVNGTNSRISQKVYANPVTVARGRAAFAASLVGPILKGLEDFLGIEYPYSKLDHMSVALEYFGAMENIGLQVYDEDDLMYVRDIDRGTNNKNKMRIIRFIAHETSHQFFGDLATPSWWSCVWLNEGMATLFESLIPSIVFPQYNQMSFFITRNLPSAFDRDTVALSSWSMNEYAESPKDLWTKFNAIGYQKSGCVVRMFMEVMTRGTFAKGLNSYLRDMYFKAATPEDLHRNLQAAYDADFGVDLLNISEAMLTWENQPGFPLISVSISGSDLKFTQRRYPVSNGEIYAVPLTFATKASPDFNETTPKQWLTSENSSFTQTELNFNATSNDWIVLNVQQVGYYRVDYDNSLWRAIIDQLNTNHAEIDPINRAVLQDEVRMAWTELSRVTAGDVLDILSYFGKEDEPVAWNKADVTLASLYLKLFTTQSFTSFLNFLDEISSPHLSNVGFDSTADEPVGTTDMRQFVKKWNCMALNRDCLRHEEMKLELFYHTGHFESLIDLCAANRYYNCLDKIVMNITSSRSYGHRSEILSHLGCSLDAGDLKLLLESTRNFSNILTADERSSIILQTATKSPVALGAVLAFIEENVRSVDDLFTTMTLANSLKKIAKYIHASPFVDVFKRILTALLDEGFLSGSSVVSISRTLAENQLWMDTNYDAIEAWLVKRADGL